MSLHAACPECFSSFKLPDEQEGRRVRCRNCQAIFTATSATGSESKPTAKAITSKLPGPPAKPVRITKIRPEPKVTSTPPALPEPVQKPNNHLPWIIGGSVACVGLIAVSAIAVALILKPQIPTPVPNVSPSPPPAPQAFVLPPPPPSPPATTLPPTVIERIVNASPSNASGEGRISAEARDKVKHATVYILVTLPDGRQASGSGFFGATEAPNIILTNAHVVGMLAPESRKPKKVEIVLNSGESNVKKTQARVLGVDRVSDLAVLDVGTTDGMPVPLTVKPATNLQELDSVYVFGFPLGKSLGEEITIRPSSISALRKRNGVLDRVQVNGGMDPGNSGGPVVDVNGDVVGVAVSGYEGRLINFAIPGERVHAILNGRLSTLEVGQTYLTDGKLSVPITMEMIDPRNLVKSAAVEVWTGDRGKPLASGTQQPEPRSGDSPHRRIDLPYSAGLAKSEIALPPLPLGKVYWIQPVYVTGGETHWAASTVHDIKPELAIERKPANLKMNLRAGTERLVSLRMKNSFRVDNDDTGDGAVMTTNVDFHEKVVSANSQGSTLRLEYSRVRRDLTVNKQKTESDPRLGSIEQNLKRMVAVLKLDPTGNPIENGLDQGRLYGSASGQMQTYPLSPVQPQPNVRQRPGSRTGVVVADGGKDKLIQQLIDFHEPVQHALEAMSIPLPNEDNVPAGKAWSAIRTLPMDTPGKYESGQLEMTYTYLGQRTRNGKAEGVIGLDGLVQGKEENESASGQTTGTAIVDLKTGVITQVDVRAVMDMEAQIVRTGKSIRLIGTLETHMDREF